MASADMKYADLEWRNFYSEDKKIVSVGFEPTRYQQTILSRPP